VREHAARYLGCDDRTSLGCATAEPAVALLEVLDDEDPFVRVEAARSLGEHPLNASREPLEKLASTDPRPEVRRAAAKSLGRIASASSRPVLEAMLDDRDELVVRDARSALEAIDATIRAAAVRAEREGRRDLEVDVELRAPAGDAGPTRGDAGRGDGGPGQGPVDP
jgi:HEAT repeat protein